MRRAARTDGNHAEIRDGLRWAGYDVVDTSRVGNGFPDLVVTRAGKVWFVELKSAKGKLTFDQCRFFAAWTGPPILVIRTLDEALERMGGKAA